MSSHLPALGDDRGISVVVGAVLLLGIVTAAAVTFRLSYVPSAGERAEADHMRDVSRSMAALNGDLLRRLDTDTGVPLPAQVPLTPSTPSLVDVPLSGGTLDFDTSSRAVDISSPSLRIQTRNGTPLLGASGSGSGQWQQIQGTDTITDVASVLGLRINITDPDPQDGDRLTIQATDANSDFAGDFQIFADVNPPDLDLIAQTRAPPAPGDVIFHNHILSIHQQNWDANYWVDALTDLFSFDSLLEQADKPMTLSFQDQGLQAAYLVSYEEDAGDGLTTLVGAGDTVDSYARSYRSGVLTYTSSNQFFTDQSYIIEHGGLILSQPDGTVFSMEPSFEVESTSNIAKLSLAVPTLKGESASVTGGDRVNVRTGTSTSQTIGATAGQLNLTFHTAFPDAWEAFLEDELADGGLTSSGCPPTAPVGPTTCEYELSSTSDTVRLTVHGPQAADADPADPVRDISFELVQGRVTTEVRR